MRMTRGRGGDTELSSGLQGEVLPQQQCFRQGTLWESGEEKEVHPFAPGAALAAGWTRGLGRCHSASALSLPRTRFAVKLSLDNRS